MIAIDAILNGRLLKHKRKLPKYQSITQPFKKNDHTGKINARYDLAISWGGSRKKFPGLEYHCETGFFYSSYHIDTLGLYENSIFNTRIGQEEWLSYIPIESANNILNSVDIPDTKYNSRNKPEVNWDGIVLALQRPKDRSVILTGSVNEYYNFVEGACKYYGKNLFLKEHPCGAREKKRWDKLAVKYGCQIGKVGHNILKTAKFILTYNSTIAVDCFLWRVPVVQFAPGYFYKTGAVTYTDRTFVNKYNDTLQLGSKLVDFLIWKYCFSAYLPDEKLVLLLNYLKDNRDQCFPLPEELSYARTWIYSKKRKRK